MGGQAFDGLVNDELLTLRVERRDLCHHAILGSAFGFRVKGLGLRFQGFGFKGRTWLIGSEAHEEIQLLPSLILQHLQQSCFACQQAELFMAAVCCIDDAKGYKRTGQE